MRYQILKCKTIRVIGGLLVTTICFGLCSNASADFNWNSIFCKQVLTLNLGPAWVHGGESQTISLEPDLAKRYTANQNDNTLFEAELFYGVLVDINPTFAAQIGLAVGGASSATLRGDIWEDADPDFNDFTYKYNLQHSHVLVKSKLIFVGFMHSITPYFSAGLGVGFNRASGFTITPKIFEAVPAPAFKTRTESAFTYTLGLGLQASLDCHWQVGVGYEFADWGNSGLAAAPGQQRNSGIQLNHFYSNELQFSISYQL